VIDLTVQAAGHPSAFRQFLETHLASRQNAARRLHPQSLFPPPSPGKTNRQLQAEAFYRLGTLNSEIGLYEQAMLQFRQAVALDPLAAAHHAALGHSLQQLGRGADAVLCYREAVRRMPGNAGLLNGLGASLIQARRFSEAVPPLVEAIRVHPEYFEAFNNLGTALLEQGEYDDALECLGHAVRLRPGHAPAHNNFGAALERLGRIPEALAEYGWAIQLQPDYVQAHINHGMALLLAGDFAHGWPEYEWRLKAGARRQPGSGVPAWDGSPLDGKTILLHSEQGLGDTIQFIRYAPLLERLGATVLLQCQPRLVPLLSSLPGGARVFAAGAEPPPHDCHLPLLSLPRMFRTTLDTIPAEIPYLRVPEERVRAWNARLGPRSGGLRVGLVWAGNRNQDNDHRRSLGLAGFAPLATVPGIRFFSLQKGPQAAELSPHGLAVEKVERESGSILDTAAILKNLDLLISVDTMPAHLAGALGRPVWTLLPFAPDWRWMRDRSDTPWYPSMRLFRQPRPGDWASVMASVAEQLRIRPMDSFKSLDFRPI
jgi:tetratricopeptide (TPR) repeat protein